MRSAGLLYGASDSIPSLPELQQHCFGAPRALPAIRHELHDRRDHGGQRARPRHALPPLASPAQRAARRARLPAGEHPAIRGALDRVAVFPGGLQCDFFCKAKGMKYLDG